MSKNISIYKENFIVNLEEFNKLNHNEFNNLEILDSLAIIERVISLIKELKLLDDDLKLLFYNISHGGYIAIKCSESFQKILITNLFDKTNHSNVISNINYYNKTNIKIYNKNINKLKQNNYILVLNINNVVLNDNDLNDLKNFIKKNKPIIIGSEQLINFLKLENNSYKIYKLSVIKDTIEDIIRSNNISVCIPILYSEKFIDEFKYYMEEDNSTLFYDNLLHLTMIVKNGGDSLENVLINNLNLIDRWTILDTGSEDNTIDIINKVLVGKKKGRLYQEPFINFRDSRNRCLDLAGKDCKYIVMLDDTYIIKGDLRRFLNTIRGDQFSDSFSLYIKSDDTEYGSNRIIKSESMLRYIYKIHEVITPKNNNNVIIPLKYSSIFDYRSDYMENRTMDRKEYDLKILYEIIDEEPNDSRAYYYLGQTYNILGKYDLAYKFYIERISHPDEGFIQEKIDSCFEAARMANFKLNKPWEECKLLYEMAYNMDRSRPDSLYFLGINYYLEANKGIDTQNNLRIAYEYFKLGFEIGYPEHCQYSLKPTLSFYFLPKFLSELSYIFENYILGEKASQLFLNKNQIINGKQPFKEIFNQMEYEVVNSWNKIFKCLNIIPFKTLKSICSPNLHTKPYFCFLVDGGFDDWTGRDILTKGIGGSETYIIELARYIQKLNIFQVIVFCKTQKYDLFEDVEYRPIMDFFKFATETEIHTCFISRYSEYIPIGLNCNNIKNVYAVFHDLVIDGTIIPRNNKFRKIFCLSEWHSDYFKNIFPILSDITTHFYYGIDFKLFLPKNNINKVPYKFIYSSFPNRGLLPLLQMWPKIIERYPEASLHIHSNIDGDWVNNVRKQEMDMIRNLMVQYQDNKILNIYYWGWTNKSDLANNWLSSDIWFYPCTFIETFCLTALEAAITKTFVITTDLGSLKNTVGDRGILLDVNNDILTAYNTEWQSKTLKELFKVLENRDVKNQLIEKNYNWAMNMSWENRAKDLIYNYIEDLPSNKLHDF